LIAPLLWKTRDSYNVDAIAQAVACAALQNRDRAAHSWQLLRQERARLQSALAQLGFAVPSSQSNFVLAEVPKGHSAAALRNVLETQGILVRHFDADRIRDALRITIGTREQNDALLAALRACL
jgi:histidinol-phosphate aminotransferase